MKNFKRLYERTTATRSKSPAAAAEDDALAQGQGAAKQADCRIMNHRQKTTSGL
jgi:hypothetical protein